MALLTPYVNSRLLTIDGLGELPLEPRAAELFVLLISRAAAC